MFPPRACLFPERDDPVHPARQANPVDRGAGALATLLLPSTHSPARRYSWSATGRAFFARSTPVDTQRHLHGICAGKGRRLFAHLEGSAPCIARLWSARWSSSAALVRQADATTATHAGLQTVRVHGRLLRPRCFPGCG